MTSTQTKTEPVSIEKSGEAEGENAKSAAAQKQESLQSALWALDAALEKKALEPVLLDVGKLCSYTEYILVLSGKSDRQVDAIAETIRIELKKHGRMPMGTEGVKSGQWALLDYADIVVHIFVHPTRERFDLEGLWVDAEKVKIDIPDDARIDVEDSYGSAIPASEE